jgi:hypothetical protein
LRWVRDVTYDEDRSAVRTGHWTKVMAALRNLATALLLTGTNNMLPRSGTTPATRSDHSPLQDRLTALPGPWLSEACSTCAHSCARMARLRVRAGAAIDFAWSDACGQMSVAIPADVRPGPASRVRVSSACPLLPCVAWVASEYGG